MPCMDVGAGRAQSREELEGRGTLRCTGAAPPHRNVTPVRAHHVADQPATDGPYRQLLPILTVDVIGGTATPT